ncbi:MAG: hypothetical protein Q9193_000562 [Seirophora villosa]
MELVGAVASITQLVDITAKTVQYLNSVKDASKERLKVAREASGLLPLLWDLQSHVDASNNEDRSRRVGSLAANHGAIDQLREALEELAKKLEPKKGLEDKLRAFVWTLDKTYTQQLLRKIERVKSSVSIALQGDTLELARNTYERTSVIRSDIDRLKTDKESRWRKEVLEWLSPLNFFKTQQDTFARREEGTGQWFIDSPEFQEWLSGINRTLCCPGIPGAGKSILASVVIDFLRARYTDQESVGVAAIYCNFKERGSQNPENLLAGCCAQIIQQELPETLLQVHSKHNAKNTRPTWEEMVEILESTVGGLDTAYLVVDALDELSDDVRNILVRFLRAPPPNIRLLVTTRHKVEITSEFNTFSMVQIRANLDDLKLYVKSRITSSRKLSGYIVGDASLERDICDGVLSKADGMFLAAKLHLDALSTKTSIKMLKKALGRLSNDIDDLYDDALSRIMSQNEDDRTLAEKALRWVAFAYRPLRAEALQEAVAIELGEQDFDLDAIPWIDLVLDVCAGLLILDEENEVVRLVHYTAQDYFDSHAQSTFHEAHTHIARECMTYLSYKCFRLIDDGDSLSTRSNGSIDDEDSLSNEFRDSWSLNRGTRYYLCDYASLSWAQHATKSQDPALSIEIREFLAQAKLRKLEVIHAVLQRIQCSQHLST